MKRSRTLGAILSALMVTSPLTSEMLTSVSAALIPTQSELREMALEGKSALLYEIREYRRIINECQAKLESGEVSACPNVNDRKGIRLYLRGVDLLPKIQTGALAIPFLTTADIADSDLTLLRRYQKSRMCPEGLKTAKQPGFYELCVRFLEEPREQTQRERQLERKVRARLKTIFDSRGQSYSAPSLNDRLDALPDGIRPDR